jgi:hypothetical protein
MNIWCANAILMTSLTQLLPALQLVLPDDGASRVVLEPLIPISVMATKFTVLPHDGASFGDLELLLPNTLAVTVQVHDAAQRRRFICELESLIPMM